MLLRRRSRQRQNLMHQFCPSVRPFVYLSVCRQNADKTRFSQIVNSFFEDLHGLFKEHIIRHLKFKMAEIRHLGNIEVTISQRKIVRFR